MEKFLGDETKCEKMMVLIGTMFFNIFHERTIDSPCLFSHVQKYRLPFPF